ncbi:MAG: MFS transporter, partial [Anaerolineales bacterium]
SAGFIAGATVGPLVAQLLTGNDSLTGVPAAVYMAGGALGAYLSARYMEQAGRRRGLALGFIVGVIGALGAGLAVLLGNFIFFLASFVLMGASRASYDLARYAAAEMHPAEVRGHAISRVVLGGTLGSVFGPIVIVPLMGQWAASLGFNELAGPWFASAALFMIGALLMVGWLRPDPSELALQVPTTGTDVSGLQRPWMTILRLPQTQAALSALILGQVVMVAIMVITAVHMNHHGHSLVDISFVIFAHTLGMFGPAVISGRLADRWGRGPVIVTGAVLLIGACLLAPLSQNAFVIAVALLLLGLGWNFCYVAGGALLTDSLMPAERSRWQGATDLMINVASGIGSLGSGVVFAALGYTLMAGVGLIATLIPLAFTVRWLWLRQVVVLAPAAD